MSSAEIQTAVLGAAKTVASTCLLYLIGSTLAFKKLVDRPFLKLIAGLANAMFLPCFRFSYIGGNVTPDVIAENWIPILYTGFLFTAGLLVALPLSIIAGPTKEFWPWFVLCATFPNIIALPSHLSRTIYRHLPVCMCTRT